MRSNRHTDEQIEQDNEHEDHGDDEDDVNQHVVAADADACIGNIAQGPCNNNSSSNNNNNTTTTTQ